MNRESYNTAWDRLLSARRSQNLEEVESAAAELLRQTRFLIRENRAKERLSKVICDHAYIVNGYCVRCGANLAKP